MMIRYLNFIVFIFVITACAVIPPSDDDYYFNEIIILNNAKVAVTNVIIKVDKTRMVFKCGYIAPKGECSNKFRKRKYLGNPVSLKWSFLQKEYSADQLILDIPEGFLKNKMIKGVLEINDNGSIKPYLKQTN